MIFSTQEKLSGDKTKFQVTLHIVNHSCSPATSLVQLNRSQKWSYSHWPGMLAKTLKGRPRQRCRPCRFWRDSHVPDFLLKKLFPGRDFRQAGGMAPGTLRPKASYSQKLIGYFVVVVKLLSLVQLFVTQWTAARQAPLSIGFSRQEYWSGLPCPPPGDLPDPGIQLESLMSPPMAGRFFPSSEPKTVKEKVVENVLSAQVCHSPGLQEVGTADCTAWLPSTPCCPECGSRLLSSGAEVSEAFPGLCGRCARLGVGS